MKTPNGIYKVLLILILALLVGSYWYLISENSKFRNDINQLTDGLDRNITDVSTVVDQVITAQGDIIILKKRVDKLKSMLYNANNKIERLQDKVECQQSQIVILRKEFK
jgi:peptidoglycan hydrolase CwlO-like protein